MGRGREEGEEQEAASPGGGLPQVSEDEEGVIEIKKIISPTGTGDLSHSAGTHRGWHFNDP